MPRNKDIHKVLVIGSGPIIIGQAAEFDYAGTQACRSLKEEGMEVVLLNSNPATIMTDKDIADKVYIEPLTVEVVEQLILKEQPDSVLPTLGGQAGLNLAMELEEKGFLKEHNVRLIGTTAETIKKAEDRQEFKDTMEKIGEPVAASKVVTTVEDGVAFTRTIGYPVVLRPAYTLGGSGGGIANNEFELREILENGLRLSRVGEVLVERCIAGWKEIEYEVMRDSAGNCITVCNMENIDPVGVHTGDSIVVAPSQTLGDKEYQMLRTSALNIITELGITGGCNVQYALHPESFEYCVIEVNPRVSRSSALASKATGYPIAKVAAKIALGYTLDEIPNAITGKTYASFEPMLDYCVVKIPRLPFDKFITAKRTLTTQMKATGEVMSICHNFEGALMKAIRSLEQHVDSLMSYDFTGLDEDELIEELAVVDDRRIWKIAEAIRRDISSDCFCYFPDTTVIYNCQFFDQLILIKTCKVIGHKTVYMLFQRTDGFHEGTFEVVADTHNFTGCFHLSCQSSLCSNKFIKRKSRDLNYTVVKHRLETCICFSCNSVRNLIQCIAQSNLCSNFSNRITCSFTCQCGRTTYTRVYLNNTVFKTLRMKSVLYVTSACDSKLCDNIQRRSTKHLVFFVSQCLGRSNYDGVTGMYTNRVNIFHVADCDTVACAVTHNFVFDFFPSCDAAFYQNFSYS